MVNIGVLPHVNVEVKDLVAKAAARAARGGQRCIQSADIALALFSSDVFAGLGLDQERQSAMMKNLDEIRGEEHVHGMPFDVYVYSDEVKRILAYALEDAQRSGEVEMQVKHLLAGLLRECDCPSARVLQAFGVSLSMARALR